MFYPQIHVATYLLTFCTMLTYREVIFTTDAGRGYPAAGVFPYFRRAETTRGAATGDACKRNGPSRTPVPTIGAAVSADAAQNSTKPPLTRWLCAYYLSGYRSSRIFLMIGSTIAAIRKCPTSFGWTRSTVHSSRSSEPKYVSPSTKYTFLSPAATAFS